MNTFDTALKIFANIVLILIVVLAISYCQPANAQMVCGKRVEVIQQLVRKYGETRTMIGLQQGRGIVETWGSNETGSWTITVTDPRGSICMLAAGESLVLDPGPAKEEKRDEEGKL